MHIWALFLKSHLFHHLISVTWAETASFSIGIQDVATPAERCFCLLLPIVTPDHLCLPRPPPSLTSSAWSQRRLCCRGGRSHQAAWSLYSWICALSWRYTPEREMGRAGHVIQKSKIGGKQIYSIPGNTSCCWMVYLTTVSTWYTMVLVDI